MYTTLLILTIVFFIAHVLLLFTSFGKAGFQKTKYLFSHITLWICGILAYLTAFLYAGKNVSTLADVFDTPMKQGFLIVLVVILSIVAHSIVKYLVLPRFLADKENQRS
jgi:H+/gluconate symporter-like permease